MASMFDPTKTLQMQNPELLELSRQRRMADLLTSRGMETPQGQMVGPTYVPTNPLQYLANLYSVYAGTRMGKDLDKRELALAEQLRQKEIQDINRFSELQYGRPAQQMEMAGPYGAGVGEESANIPMPTLDMPEVKANPQLAFQLAATSQSPVLRQQLAEMLKGQKLGEGEVITRYNPATGQMETVASGAAKVRAPIQIDTGTTIELRDPLDPTKVLQRIPKAQMPTAGQVVEREDGTYLVDTRTGQAKPVVGPQGQPLIGGKPLTETQSNAVAFGMRAVEANKIATDLENKGFTNTGVIRTAIGGTVGTAPIVGEKLEQGVRSTFNVLPQVLGGPSAEQQQNDQARRNFISAVLRKESGAAISPTEYVNEERKYFPQLGDDEKVIKQKQQARELAIKALEAQAGSSGKRMIEKNASQQLSTQDQEALNWANSNPNDPRSAQIKQRLGR
jgi:hypothetical protein